MKENTNYRLSSSVNDGIVEIVITGVLTENTIDMLHDEVLKIIREKNARAMLVDVRAVKGPNEITEAYFRVRSIPPDIKILPSAIVELPENRDFQSFYETTAANIGMSMRFFADIEDARAWLKSRL